MMRERGGAVGGGVVYWRGEGIGLRQDDSNQTYFECWPFLITTLRFIHSLLDSRPPHPHNSPNTSPKGPSPY